MVRHLHHWLDMVEALLIIGILLAIGWVTWLALTQAYSPVFKAGRTPLLIIVGGGVAQW